MKLKPLRDRVIVEASKVEDVTKGGIVLPETAKEKPQEGKVVAVGSGKIDESGKTVALEVKVGDTVIYSKYGGTEVKQDGTEYLILREDDILAIVGKK